MTTEEHLADLQARIALFESFFTFITNPHTGQRGCMTQGRFGIMTEYWMKQPAGQGAALSVGTVTDRFGVYTELEATACPDHPTTAYYAHVMMPNPTQRNIAFESHVAQSSIANVDLWVSGQGIEVLAGLGQYCIGAVSGVIKKIWPTYGDPT
jgi:hypothetical protein